MKHIKMLVGLPLALMSGVMVAISAIFILIAITLIVVVVTGACLLPLMPFLLI